MCITIIRCALSAPSLIKAHNTTQHCSLDRNTSRNESREGVDKFPRNGSHLRLRQLQQLFTLRGRQALGRLDIYPGSLVRISLGNPADEVDPDCGEQSTVWTSIRLAVLILIVQYCSLVLMSRGTTSSYYPPLPFPSPAYTKLHYTTLNYTTLHCTTLHYSAVQYSTREYRKYRSLGTPPRLTFHA